MAADRLRIDGDGTVRVCGPLTFDTVEEMRAAARARVGPECWREASLVFDLGGVEAADSAGLALLIAWQRTALREGGRIHFRGTPAALRAVAEVCGVDGDLFG